LFYLPIEIAAKQKKADFDYHLYIEKWGEENFFVETRKHTTGCLYAMKVLLF